MGLVTRPVAFDSFRRLSPPIHGIVRIEATRYAKHVGRIMPDLLLEAPGADGKPPLLVRFPLVSCEHQNGDVLIWVPRRPPRVSQKQQRAMLRTALGFLPLLGEHGIPLPAGRQAKGEAIIRVVIVNWQSSRLSWSIQAGAAASQQTDQGES